MAELYVFVQKTEIISGLATICYSHFEVHTRIEGAYLDYYLLRAPSSVPFKQKITYH